MEGALHLLDDGELGVCFLLGHRARGLRLGGERLHERLAILVQLLGRLIHERPKPSGPESVAADRIGDDVTGMGKARRAQGECERSGSEKAGHDHLPPSSHHEPC